MLVGNSNSTPCHPKYSHNYYGHERQIYALNGAYDPLSTKKKGSERGGVLEYDDLSKKPFTSTLRL